MTRAAAYCRVSTDQQDQLNSFESQKIYFRNYIENQPGWALAEIYADEGITGTTTTDRRGFLRMIDDARKGKFDVILTKEVSRFSRNILDAVAYTRELRHIGIAVIFISDGISTTDPDAELRLGIMAAVAQEESRKTSERVKWGQQRMMERGVVFGRSLLGYDVRGGKITVEPEGAEIVRMIYGMYLRERMGVRSIADELTGRGIATQRGNTAWSGAAVLKILRNEKYCGDLVQRKTVTTDYLTHKKTRNRGDQAFICHQDHHEPIVGREDWNAVQKELSRRSSNSGQSPRGSRYALSGRIACCTCGAVYRCRTRQVKNGEAYRVWVRQCVCPSACHQLREDAVEHCLRCFIAQTGRDTLLSGFAEITAHLCAPAEPEIRQNILYIEGKLTRLAEVYIEGEIHREAYLNLKESYETALRNLEYRLKGSGKTSAPEISVFIDQLSAGSLENGAFFLELADRVSISGDAVEIFLKDLLIPIRAVYK